MLVTCRELVAQRNAKTTRDRRLRCSKGYLASFPELAPARLLMGQLSFLFGMGAGGYDGVDADRKLCQEQAALLTQAPTTPPAQDEPKDARPQVILVVEMYGGTIDNVTCSNPNVRVTDVVFLENHEYGNGDEDEPEVFVKDSDGQDTDLFIYTHHVDVGTIEPADLQRVMAAAATRAGAA